MPHRKNPAESSTDYDSFEAQGVSIPIRDEDEAIHLPTTRLPQTADDDESRDSSNFMTQFTLNRYGLSTKQVGDLRKSLNNGVEKSQRSPLRPAKDIISRIRHDPAYGAEHFVIGYVDRHRPGECLEKEVTEWKADFTDEEWIPQHRIEYFRRKGDEGPDCFVWIRDARLDKVFGSGIPDQLEKLSQDEFEERKKELLGSSVQPAGGPNNDEASSGVESPEEETQGVV